MSSCGARSDTGQDRQFPDGYPILSGTVGLTARQLPAIADLTAETGFVSGKAAGLEVFVVLADGGINESERSSSLESEAAVVTRVAQERHNGPTLAISLLEQCRHEGDPYALALSSRDDSEWRDRDHLTSNDVSPGTKDVADDRPVGLERHQLQSGYVGSQTPRV